ncbi:MAG: hypothetical protein PV344_05065, partial [Anaplasma sp.]|nr:hypothetical protein [Anaplasma sp.]
AIVFWQYWLYLYFCIAIQFFARICISVYYKRLNFRDDLSFANFANRLRFAKNRTREKFGQCVNTTETTFDSRKLEAANNF